MFELFVGLYVNLGRLLSQTRRIENFGPKGNMSNGLYRLKVAHILPLHASPNTYILIL